MYSIDFYETSTCYSDIFEFLEELRINSNISKDSRIQYKQVARYIQLLADNGTSFYIISASKLGKLHEEKSIKQFPR